MVADINAELLNRSSVRFQQVKDENPAQNRTHPPSYLRHAAFSVPLGSQ